MLESLRDRGWEVISGIDLGQKRSFEKTVLVNHFFFPEKSMYLLSKTIKKISFLGFR